MKSLVILTLLALAIVSVSSRTRCKRSTTAQEGVYCTDGTWIPGNLVCDGYYDCACECDEHGCGGCDDYNANCSSWANSGECTNNPSYMNDECPYSCGLCWLSKLTDFNAAFPHNVVSLFCTQTLSIDRHRSLQTSTYFKENSYNKNWVNAIQTFKSMQLGKMFQW